MINYSLACQMSRPGDKTSPKKYYAHMQASGEVSLDEISTDIAYATSLTDSDVLAAIRAFIHQLNKHLAAGKIVRAGDLGSFQLQIHSEGADTEKEFTADNITGVSIQFRPGGFVSGVTTRALGSLEFRKVGKKTKGQASGSGTHPDDGGTGGTGEDGDLNGNPLG